MKTGASRRRSGLTRLAGPVYLDTSALVKLYLPEPESDTLDRALSGRRDLLVSDLAVTEVASAIGRRGREGFLPGEAGARLYRQLLADLEEGIYGRTFLGRESHRSAERLLLASRVALRTLDALHLALAVEAAAASIVTFDGRLAAAAFSVGLSAAPGVSARVPRGQSDGS